MSMPLSCTVEHSGRSTCPSCAITYLRHGRPTLQLSSNWLYALADTTKLMETRIIPRTGDPVWNEAHTVAVAHDVKSLRFLVKDNDRLSAEHVAEVS